MSKEAPEAKDNDFQRQNPATRRLSLEVSESIAIMFKSMVKEINGVLAPESDGKSSNEDKHNS